MRPVLHQFNRTFAQICAFSVAMVLVSTECSAQVIKGPLLPRETFGAGQEYQPVTALLTIKEVQDELKLNEDQLKELVGDARTLNQNIQPELRIASRSRDGNAFADLNKRIKEREQPLMDKLTDEQKKRLVQLNYQRLGVQALKHVDVRNELQVTDEQMAAYEKVRSEMQDVRSISSIRNREEATSKLKESKERFEKALDAILTDDQKQKLKEMRGEPFAHPLRLHAAGV
ncbi:MAG: hypothetical protein U0936_23270 [Planctomycetaceae bacterium]